MVDIVKAHIKNNSNQDIRIVIYDPATGAILKEETMSFSYAIILFKSSIY